MIGIQTPTFRIIGVSTGFVEPGNNQSTFLSLSTPEGAIDGDLLIALCCSASQFSTDNTTQTPSDFTEVLDDAGVHISHRVSDGFEENPQTAFRNGQGIFGGLVGALICIRDASYDAVSIASRDDAAPSAPGITLSADGLILGFFASEAAQAIPPPSGMRQLASFETAPSMGLFYEFRGSGATGSRATTATSNTAAALVGVTAS